MPTLFPFSAATLVAAVMFLLYCAFISRNYSEAMGFDTLRYTPPDALICTRSSPVPLLFAVTLFVSASLLFMVQPMVGKLVLPLLGGSPAVWNACMVFFQALLLLGYLYADRLTRQENTRKQWLIHMCVMALPVGAFALAIVFNSRHTPIGVAESLAPRDGSSAILSVLAILTFCIGIPFFVVSTSATLLQKWFTYTGHPSARDPYFLYAASNFGSLISLLGYPIFIEPNMTQGMQTWFWAVGFIALIGLIAFCGRAAVNPLGVPPGAVPATASVGSNLSGKAGGKQSGNQNANSQKQGGSDNKAIPVVTPTEPPPTWGRMAKWTLLAFVPSSLMLGVTFHMTTDIASIPLLWVGPLALYLLTFIIAFGRTPPWFRVLIGNLAPVMILLLVFLMISEVKPGTGLELLLYNLTFFAAALMCHYELARDRPSPQYLTTYFLIMSFGGVLGGIFNSLIAPLIFTQSYEFPLALIVACFMVPRLLPEEEDKSGAPAQAALAQGKPKQKLLWGWVQDEEDYLPVTVGSAAMAVVGLLVTLPAYQWLSGLLYTILVIVVYNVAYMFLWKPFWRWYQTIPSGTRRWVAIALDFIIPILLGVLFWQTPRLLASSDWYANWVTGLAQATTRIQLTPKTMQIVVLFALPVMVCFFFVDRPVRFALCVAAILGPTKIREGSGAGVIHTERSFFGILKIEETEHRQHLVDRTKYDKLTDDTLVTLRKTSVLHYVEPRLIPPKYSEQERVLQKLAPLKDKDRDLAEFQREIAKLLTPEELKLNEEFLLKAAFVPERMLQKLLPLKDREWERAEYQSTLAKLVTPEELKLYEAAILNMAFIPEQVLQKISPLKDREWERHELQRELAKLLTPEELRLYEEPILKNTFLRANPGETAVRDAGGKPIVAGVYEYRRLVHGTTLHGTQVSKHDRHFLDDFQFLTAANPWDNLAVMGAIQNFDMRQEPLTYYHRTGPVGAMFNELTRRGKDKEHVAMVGLGTGSVSCYAQKGQRLTYYEIDPAVRKLVETPWKVMNEKELKERGSAPISDPEVRQLVEKIRGVTIYDQATYDEKRRVYAEEMRQYQVVLQNYLEECKRRKAAGESLTDRPDEPAKPPAVPDMGPFTFVDDARKRGAEIDFRMGDARLKLKDTDDKYALLLVDAFSSDSIPVHLLTVEAVGLYLDRLKEDGILALHISNKYVRLEPVVAAIAEKHNLVARVWNDDAEGKHGKTASSWVVLARKREDLGDRLCSPISDLMTEYYHGRQLSYVLERKYPELKSVLEKATGKQQETLVKWLEDRPNDPQAKQFAAWIRKYGSEFETLMTILQRETGYGFRPLTPMRRNTPLWTDDYADVMRVMMIEGLQSVRKFFGLPTLDEDE